MLILNPINLTQSRKAAKVTVCIFSCVAVMFAFAGCGASESTGDDGRSAIAYWRTLTGGAGDAQEELAISEPEDAVVFCPVTFDEGGDLFYVNLLGPFVVNATTRNGRQIVLSDSDFPVRAPIEIGGA